MTENKKIIIALDGPSGSGKSTAARAVAKKLGILYVDTGALYRTVGLYVKRCGVDPTDGNAVCGLLDKVKIELKFNYEGQRVILNGEDVSDLIRNDEMSRYSSAVSAIGGVREFLLDMQRSMADKNSIIMDGRDIGTVIFPNADVKIFMYASSEVRAKRRYDEYTAKGIECDYEKVLADIIQRDRNDSGRKLAPAVPAADAVMLDNSLLDFDGTVNAIVEIVRKKGIEI